MSFKSTISEQWNGREVKIQGKSAAERSAFEIGLIVEGQAKALAPIKSGRLAGSITTQSADKGSAPEAPATQADVIAAPQSGDEVLVGTAVDYGPYIEFGTINTDAQPFLRPALDLSRGKALTIVEREGRLAFKEYLK